MHAFHLLAQGGGGQGPNYIRLIGFLIIVGFTVLSWVLRKLQEQSAKKKVQEEIERRELELLRTGRPQPEAFSAPAPPPTPAATPTASADVNRRIEELRRRREAMARRRAEDTGNMGAQAPGAAPPTAPSPQRPAPARERPAILVAAEAPVFVPRQRAAPIPPAPPVARAPARPKREPRSADPGRAKPPPQDSGRGNLADTLQKRDRAQAVRAADSAPAVSAAPRTGDAIPRTPADWRRALIAREVLAPPLGLRSGDGSPPEILP